MSASKAAKSIGLPSLKYVCDKANVKRSTIYNWYKHNKPLFNAVINGVERPKKVTLIQITGITPSQVFGSGGCDFDKPLFNGENNEI